MTAREKELKNLIKNVMAAHIQNRLMTDFGWALIDFLNGDKQPLWDMGLHDED